MCWGGRVVCKRVVELFMCRVVCVGVVELFVFGGCWAVGQEDSMVTYTIKLRNSLPSHVFPNSYDLTL